MPTLSALTTSPKRRYPIRIEGICFCYDCGAPVSPTRCAVVGPVWDESGENAYMTYHCGCDPDGAVRRRAEVGDHQGRREQWLQERGLW